jgi:5-methylcytosine-specific restriction endonuclease McrA
VVKLVLGNASRGRGEILAPLPCDREPRQVKRAKQRAGAHGYRGPHFTATQWRELVEACGGRCLRCGVVEDLTVDHIVPLALGGSNAIENIQPLCHDCNGIKGCETTDYRPGRGILREPRPLLQSV